MRRLGVLALVVLVACGGSDPETTAPTTAGETTTTTEATTTTEPARTTTTRLQATVEQYASIIAEHGTDLRANLESARECALTYPDCGLAAIIETVTAGLEADTLFLLLTDGQSPSSDLFIGEPPAELDDLIARTSGAAHLFSDLVESFEAAGCQTDTPAPEILDECNADLLRADGYARDLQGALEAWAPYL